MSDCYKCLYTKPLSKENEHQCFSISEQSFNSFKKKQQNVIYDINHTLYLSLWDQLSTNIFDFTSPQLSEKQELALVQIVFLQIKCLQDQKIQYTQQTQHILSQKLNQVLTDQVIAEKTDCTQNIDDFIEGYKYLSARTVNKYGQRYQSFKSIEKRIKQVWEKRK